MVYNFGQYRKTKDALSGALVGADVTRTETTVYLKQTDLEYLSHG